MDHSLDNNRLIVHFMPIDYAERTFSSYVF